jgi:hypothetical protein
MKLARINRVGIGLALGRVRQSGVDSWLAKAFIGALSLVGLRSTGSSGCGGTARVTVLAEIAGLEQVPDAACRHPGCALQ